MEKRDNNKKTHYDVLLKSFGEKKISIIKEVKLITGLSLIKAKEMVDSVPQIIKNNIPIETAEKLKNKLELLGAKVILK
jgi:large subunit ribosomal protein L7/L12